MPLKFGSWQIFLVLSCIKVRRAFFFFPSSMFWRRSERSWRIWPSFVQQDCKHQLARLVPNSKLYYNKVLEKLRMKQSILTTQVSRYSPNKYYVLFLYLNERQIETGQKNLESTVINQRLDKIASFIDTKVRLIRHCSLSHSENIGKKVWTKQTCTQVAYFAQRIWRGKNNLTIIRKKLTPQICILDSHWRNITGYGFVFYWLWRKSDMRSNLMVVLFWKFQYTFTVHVFSL
jgi:hypothetical protein